MKCLFVSVCFCSVSVALAQQSLAVEKKDPLQILREMSGSLEELSRRISPSVVGIETFGYGPVEDSGQSKVASVARHHAAGSGVVVDADGYIITNAHVLENAQRVKVALMLPVETKLPGRAMRMRRMEVDAKIAGIDKETDLALLKVDLKQMAAMRFGNSDALRQGQMVLAMGNPLGLENSLTMGVISSTERQLRPDDALAFIQTDTPINPGNSGGPLIDVEGRLIGINTFIYTQSGGSEGIGFAIPSSVVRNIYLQLRKNGHVHRVEIGAAVQTVTPVMAAGLKLPQDWGVIVADVLPGGPAEVAGLRYKDILLAMNGRTMEAARHFEAGLYRANKGEDVELDVLRNGERVKVKVAVAERSDDMDRLAEKVSLEKNLIAKLGMLFLEVDKKVVEMIPGLRKHYGVVVAAKAADVASQDVPLQTGDVVHAINDELVVSLEGFRASINKLKTGDPVVLEVERPGRIVIVSFEWQ